MKAETLSWTEAAGWTSSSPPVEAAQLVLYWGARERIASGEPLAALQRRLPGAAVVGCSTGGQIFAGDVHDDLVCALALRFEATPIAVVETGIDAHEGCFAAGAALGRRLLRPDLRLVFVVSDGLRVNGSDLVAGLAGAVGPETVVTGGLAGDGTGFETTVVGADSAPIPGRIVAIGFYGAALSVGHGSAGGWDEFGPKRRVTRAEKNVVFTLDDEPALDLYERYLGEEADGLPETALRYPLLVADPANPAHSVVRAVLGVNRAERSMIFGGNVPQGWCAQLMLGHLDHLAEGAAQAARQAASVRRAPGSHAVAIMVSCIGRRVLMGQRIADEIAEVEANIGANVQAVGFYSYGEIAPHGGSGLCELHNETMTLTTLAEVV